MRFYKVIWDFVGLDPLGAYKDLARKQSLEATLNKGITNFISKVDDPKHTLDALSLKRLVSLEIFVNKF